MRGRFVLSLLAAVATSASSHPQSSPRIEDASWLAGCWSMGRTDDSTGEHWLAPAGGAMLGLSRTVRAGKMTDYEHRKAPDGIAARIEGVVGGKPRRIDFPFERCK
jgi:hypothetical protein